MTGLDVLERTRFADFKGKRIGLITNQTGLDREGRRNIDAMLAAGVQVVRLFSPEHGLAGAAMRIVATQGRRDEASRRQPVYASGSVA